VGWEYLETGGIPLWVFALYMNSGEVVCNYDDRTLPAGINPVGMEYIVVGVDRWFHPIRVARTIVR
jgi:hypothetical protein